MSCDRGQKGLLNQVVTCFGLLDTLRCVIANRRRANAREHATGARAEIAPRFAAKVRATAMPADMNTAPLEIRRGRRKCDDGRGCE